MYNNFKLIDCPWREDSRECDARMDTERYLYIKLMNGKYKLSLQDKFCFHLDNSTGVAIEERNAIRLLPSVQTVPPD